MNDKQERRELSGGELCSVDRSGTPIDRRQFIFQAGAFAACTMMGMGLAGCSMSGTKNVSDGKDGSSESISIIDQLGKTVTFAAPPQRVATTIIPFPSIYYALMGDTDTLVGANPSSMPAYEKSTLKSMYPTMTNVDTGWCSSNFTVNVEELLRLKPDVVFQWTTQPEDIQKMEDAGLKVIALKYGTVDDLKTWITILGTLFQKEDRAQFLIDYFDKRIARISDKTSAIPESEKPSAILLSENLTVSGTGFTPYWMDQSGAQDLGASLASQSAKVDMEQILSWNPQFVYVGNFTSIQPSDLMENKLDGQDWSHVDAVKNNRVYKIPIGAYRWDPPCVETPLMVAWLAKLQHPDVFAEMDMNDEVRSFYQDVYDYNLSDVELPSIFDHRHD